MKPWYPAETKKIEKGKEYFLVKFSDRRHIRLRPSSQYISLDINGKTIYSIKPGIAIRFDAKSVLKAMLDLTMGGHKVVAVEVPHDASERWRRRKKRFR